MGTVNPLFHSLFRQYNWTTGDELCPGGHEWRHLSLHGLPDDPAQLRMWCQGDLVKAPGRLADGWRWKIWWCSGRHWPDQLLGDDCRLHSDMLLQEWLVPNNVNVCLVLSCSQPHGLWWQARISCMHQGGHPGGGQVKVIPSEQLHLEKVLTASGAKYPLAHVITRHFTLATGANMADMDSLFTGQIPTKVLISLVSNEAFVSTWQKNTFNFAHIKLNSACLVVDGRQLPAQPWQPDFMQGLQCPTEVQWHVPQLLEQRNVCRAFRGWHHAVVLGPDAQRQQRCGLSIPQTSWHRQSQSEIRKALAGDHHTDSLCPVW